MISATPKRDRLLRPARHSPFDKIIAFDYEDGPTHGLVHDDDRPTTYRFDVLAIDIDGLYDHESWDRGEEIRIYRLAPLPSSVFERTVELLSTVEPPTWPVWVPGASRPSRAMEEILAREIDPLLKTDGPFQIVAASSLLAPLLASAPTSLAADDRDVDWFAFLGFTTPSTSTTRA